MLQILLVEDSPHDILFVQEALKDLGIRHTMLTAQDGEGALQMLAGGARPDIIFLDLNLPGMTGLEVLAAIKSTPETSALPVIVLTNSQREEDVIKAYKAQCNAYIRKPMGYDKIVKNFEAFKIFWLEAVTLPGHTGPLVGPPDPPEAE
jgi:CheY-like chemotaxis protein